MRRPRMSTGAWIFTGLICAAVIAPASVYAASAARTALVGLHGTNAADVTAQHQLLTTPIPPSKVVRAVKVAQSGCTSIYTPPAGKAIMVTSVVYNFGTGTSGVETFGGLFAAAGCGPTAIVDQIDQVEKFGSIQHTYPTGVPMSSVNATNFGGDITVCVVGYLIDHSSLPSSAMSHVSGAVKAVPTGR